MTNLTVPDEFDAWPHEARRFVLAESNTGADLRAEIDALAGLDSTEWTDDAALQLTKDQAAAVVMALGGPQGGDR